jgi:hypothetical protein
VLADLPFPRTLRDELVAAGRAQPHHIVPESGWVSFHIESLGDVDEAIALFRLAYDRAEAALRRLRRMEAPLAVPNRPAPPPVVPRRSQ